MKENETNSEPVDTSHIQAKVSAPEKKVLAALEALTGNHIKKTTKDDYKRLDAPFAFTTHDGHVTGLYLTHFKLETIPDVIFKLTWLQELVLHDGNIETVPNEIGNLKSLELLDLSTNKIECLPDSICELSLLQKFIVYDNRLIALPERIGNLKSLKRFLFGNNKIASLPDSVSELNPLDIEFEKDKVPSRIYAISKITDHVILFSTSAVVFFVAGYWHAGMFGGFAGAGVGLLAALMRDLDSNHDFPLSIKRRKHHEFAVQLVYLLIIALGTMGLGAWFGAGSGFGTIPGMRLGFTLGAILASIRGTIVHYRWLEFKLSIKLLVISIGIGTVAGGFISGWGGGAPIGAGIAILAELIFEGIIRFDRVWIVMMALITGLVCTGLGFGIPLELSLAALGLSFILGLWLHTPSKNNKYS
nr:leucine-rich repeat domain-containing protein [Candidatus Sigynarchaeota archaeon]